MKDLVPWTASSINSQEAKKQSGIEKQKSDMG